MSWAASIFVALLTGVVGLLAGGFLMSLCVRWYRVSSFEGGSGYAVIAVALLGGLVGLLLGLGISRVSGGAGAIGFLKGLGAASGSTLVLAGLITAVAWLLADIPPEIDGKQLRLEVELRLPVGTKESPAKGSGESFIELASVIDHVRRDSRRGELRPQESRFEDGRWIVPGSAFLFTRRGLRSLDLQLNGEKLQGFLIPLPSRPSRAFEEWSDWGPRPPAPNPPWPDSKPSYRFRVKPIEPPAPGPTPEEQAAAEAADEKRRFEAMDPSVPVAAWIPWTRAGVSEPHQWEAIRRMTARPTFVEELASLMTAEDPTAAAEALLLVDRIQDPPQGLVEAVERAGRDIADRLRKVNTTSVEADPGYVGAADISRRFSSWMVAVRRLRGNAGGDFTPELKVILELSRVRSDSIVLRGDVLRVASYYMSEWAGLKPLPGDPSPN